MDPPDSALPDGATAMNPPVVPRQSRPTFLFFCHDGPDAPRLRAEHLDGHLRHVERHWQSYVTAGPLRVPGETALVASALIVIADTVEDAWAIMRGDPYMQCGLWERIAVHDMTMSVGLYPGGRIWPDADSIRDRAAGG